MCGRSGIVRSHSFRVLGCFLILLVLVIMLVIEYRSIERDHEQDYGEASEVTLSTFAYISR
jgi:hypothetical protein